MNEEEALLRKELRSFRSVATSLQLSVRLDELFIRDPMFQAEAIIKGYSYWLPSRLFVRTLLATGELQLKDEVCPACGYIVTKEEQRKEKIDRVEKILKQLFDPVAVTREMTMPLVKDWLESMECYMVEQGYRLPKWERPQWLRVMEGKEAKE